MRELSKLFIDFFIDCFVWFPMLILFLYYMYYNDNGMKYAISFDIAFVIFMFHGVFRFFSSICYDMDLNTSTHDWISQLFFMSLVVKSSFISFIFACIYLIQLYGLQQNQNKSIFLLIVSIIFTVFGSITWCLVCYICAGCCCAKKKKKKKKSKSKSKSIEKEPKHNHKQIDNKNDCQTRQ